MPKCNFRLEVGQAEGERPQVLTDAVQVIDCTWMRIDHCRRNENYQRKRVEEKKRK